MKSRFIAKKVKIVWRNSMIAGNPIVRSFTKFGVFDRNWENDRYCRCPRPGGEWPTDNGSNRKYRVVVDDEALAKKLACKLNSLVSTIHNGATSQVEFGVAHADGTMPLSTYVTDDDISRVCIAKSIAQ